MKCVTRWVRDPVRTLPLLLLFAATPLTAAPQPDATPRFHPLPLALAESDDQHDLQDVVDMAAFEALPDPEQLRMELQALEQDRGPWDKQLVTTALALARTLQQLEQHTEALTFFEQARQIIRANAGPYTLEQAGILEDMITSHLALHDTGQADALHDALFRLVQRAPGAPEDLQTEAALRLADWQVRRYLQQRRDGSLESRTANTTIRLISTQLDQAYNLYADILRRQRANPSVSSEALIATERRIAGLVRLVSNELQADGQVSLTRLGEQSRQRKRQTPNRFLFKDGTTALQRAVAYHLDSPAPNVEAAALRMLELGDWYLLLDERTAALQTYEEALALLDTATAGSDPELPLKLGSGLPAHDPALRYTEPDSGMPADYDGYIDVEFEVNRFGKALRPHIITSSSGEQALHKTLLRRIRSSTFRPGFAGDGVLAQHKVQLRYYYSL